MNNLMLILMVVFTILLAALRIYMIDFQKMKTTVYNRLRKLATSINEYIKSHVDDQEKEELLSILKDNEITATELKTIIFILLSKNDEK